jgi:hypothetical protein
MPMVELLNFVVEAQGGMARWRALKSIAATFSLEGSLWQAKGKGGVVVGTTARADCHRQHITYEPFTGPSTRSVFEDDCVLIESLDGRTLQKRENARSSFAGHTRATPWDDLHLAYFTGYAMWNYLTTPFLFTMPGFACPEIAPWQEDGERWRRLRVVFPPHIATHCAEQVFYFDARGLLRRLDYRAEVAGGSAVAHYVSGHVTVGGIVVPRQRRALFRKPDGQANREVGPGVAIDFTAVTVA